jgi:hypothetical protein
VKVVIGMSSISREMRWLWGWLLPHLIGLFVFTSARTATAQSLTLEVERDVVGVGQTIQATLQAFAPEGVRLTGAALALPPGFTILGKTEGSMQSMSIVNGRTTIQTGVVTTWTVRASRVGRFSLGPASATASGRAFSSGSASVSVQKNTPEPQDPFQALLRGMGVERERDPEPPINESLSLPKARGQGVFLHATLEINGEPVRGALPEVYVGEQITWTLDLYRDVRMGEPDFLDVKEAHADDCLKRPIIQGQELGRSLGYADVDGQRYEVRRERRIALFPLHAGKLTISPFSLLVGARQREKRESEAFELSVRPPPEVGRPRGFRMGDTGRFELACSVAPRSVPQGGSVVVTATLNGRGNIPNRLLMPVASDFEFLEPEAKEELRFDEKGIASGRQTLTYLVRVRAAGNVDLGKLQLPHFDEREKQYRVASCDLGRVVTALGASSTPTPGRVAKLPPMPPLRSDFEAQAGHFYVADHKPLVAALLALPSFGFIATLAALLRSQRARGAAGRLARKDQSDQAAQLAADFVRRDPVVLARSLRTFVETMVERECGVRLRALTHDEALVALTERDIAPARAGQILGLYTKASELGYSTEPITNVTCAELRVVVDSLTAQSKRSNDKKKVDIKGAP